MSRSATTVISYLMGKQPGLTFEEALSDVIAKRTCVAPNRGFCDQLRILQDKCHGYLESYTPQMLQVSSLPSSWKWRMSVLIPLPVAGTVQLTDVSLARSIIHTFKLTERIALQLGAKLCNTMFATPRRLGNTQDQHEALSVKQWLAILIRARDRGLGELPAFKDLSVQEGKDLGGFNARLELRKRMGRLGAYQGVAPPEQGDATAEGDAAAREDAAGREEYALSLS